MNEQNAIIKSTRLGSDGHGILTIFINLDYGGSGQSFGGHDLRPEGKLLEWVNGVLRAVGVRTWEDLVGTHCRVRRDSPRGPVIAIGHIIEDKWFTP